MVSHLSFHFINMAAHIGVTVSGPALSFLIYENVKSYCDQEGFLVGDIISHVTDTISDSQIRGEKTETIISINSLMPIPNSMSFYNGIGKINLEKLKSFLKDKTKEVIGWYSFRRNSSLVPHLRDTLLHKELSVAAPHVSPEHFIMCLLNTSTSNGGSTHIFNHKFMRYRHSKFEALPMQIHNLGETQPEYKLVPSTTCLSESFNSIISSLNHSDKGSDAALVCHIQKALQEHLWKLINDVATSEMQVADLEKEVEMLREQSAPTNEVLPQLHEEREEIKVELPSGGLSELPEPSALTPAKPNRQTANHTAEDSSNSNHIGIKTKDGSGDDASTEPFAFVTEMKNQMSLSPSQPTSSIGSSETPANVKRSTERGRGIGRTGGVGRGMRKTSQQSQQMKKQEQSPQVLKSCDNLEVSSTRRGGSTGTSPARTSGPRNNTRGVKQGYAQVVRCSPGGPEAPKPVTRSQVNSTSNSQEYQ